MNIHMIQYELSIHFPIKVRDTNKKNTLKIEIHLMNRKNRENNYFKRFLNH